MEKKEKFCVSPYVTRADRTDSQISVTTSNGRPDSPRPRLDSRGSKAESEASSKGKSRPKLASLLSFKRPHLASKQSIQTANSSSTINSGFPTHMSKSSLRVIIVTEAHAIVPCFTSLFSLEDIPKDVLHTSSHPGLEMGGYPAVSSCRDQLDHLDVLDNPAYTDTVRSIDSASSLLRRSFSVPMQYTYKPPSHRRAHEVFQDIVKSESGQNLDSHGEQYASQKSLDEPLERPDYTDSLQSTSSGAVLLAKTIRQDSQHIRAQLPLGQISEEICYIDPKVCTKNLLVLSISFMLAFSAYTGLRNLQSSIVSDGSLALYALCSIYASVFVGCIFATTVVQHLRPKLTISLGMVAVLVFVLANFYPRFYTLVPASALTGFFLANTWTAHATYTINMAAAFSEATGKTLQSVLTRFNGIFFTFFGISQILGGIIASTVLLVTDDGNSKPAELYNNTDIRWNPEHDLYNDQGYTYDGSGQNDTSLRYMHDIEASTELYPLPGSGNKELNVTWASCGNDFCLSKHVPEPGPQVPQHTLYILLGIYAALVVAGLIVLTVFLDRLEGQMKKCHSCVGDQLTAVFRWFIDVRVFLLLGIMFYTLIQMSFMFGEFTKAFITCPLGMQLVGYGMMCMSSASSVTSYISSRLVQTVGRVPVFLGAAFIQLLMLIVMLLWTPSKDTAPVLFVMLALWGMADGIWTTQVISLMGLLFADKKEPAFAGLKMCQSLGACTNFLTAKVMCTASKIYMIIIILIIAVLGYLTLEVRLRMEQNIVNEKKSQPTKV